MTMQTASETARPMEIARYLRDASPLRGSTASPFGRPLITPVSAPPRASAVRSCIGSTAIAPHASATGACLLRGPAAADEHGRLTGSTGQDSERGVRTGSLPQCPSAMTVVLAFMKVCETSEQRHNASNVDFPTKQFVRHSRSHFTSDSKLLRAGFKLAPAAFWCIERRL